MSKLPPLLQRPLSEVSNYVEKMFNGASLTDLSNKVQSYQKLNQKEKLKLIDHISGSSSIFVYLAKKSATATPKTFLFHKKYGHPKTISGYQLFSRVENYLKCGFCWECMKEKPLSDFSQRLTIQRPSLEMCNECSEKRAAEKKLINQEVVMSVKPYIEESRAENKKTAAELRKQAELLLHEAEEAEKRAQNNDYLNKTIKPLVLKVLQDVTVVQKNVDDLITSTADLEKSISDLRNEINK